MIPLEETLVNSHRDLLKVQLMTEVIEAIDRNKLTQVEAAKLMGCNQPRISNLKQRLDHKFSIDMLITMLLRINESVYIEVGKKISTTKKESHEREAQVPTMPN